MLKKLAFALVLSLASLSALPATAAQIWYSVDSWGNHRLNIYNDVNALLYCSIRGSNGTWGNVTIPPGFTGWFHVYGASNSYWNCHY